MFFFFGTSFFFVFHLCFYSHSSSKLTLFIFHPFQFPCPIFWKHFLDLSEQPWSSLLSAFFQLFYSGLATSSLFCLLITKSHLSHITSPFLPPLKYFTHFKIFPSLPTGFQILSLIKIQLLAFLEKRKKRIIFKSSSFLLHATSTHYPRLVFPNDFVFFWSILKAKANWMIKLRECGTNRN